MSKMWKERHQYESKQQDKRDAVVIVFMVVAFIVSAALRLSGLF